MTVGTEPFVVAERAKRIAQVQRLAEAYQQIELIARREPGDAYLGERVAGCRQVCRVAVSETMALQACTRGDERGGVGRSRIDASELGSSNCPVEIESVVQGTRLGKRRMLGRCDGDRPKHE